MIPKLEGKICIRGAQSTNEVVFEGLDGPFCCVDPMVVGFHKLQAAILLLQVFPDGLAGLVVCDAEGWLVSFVGEGLEDGFVGGDDVVVGRGGDGYGKDVIWIVGVRDKK